LRNTETGRLTIVFAFIADAKVKAEIDEHGVNSITEGNLPHLSERQDHEVVISLTGKNVRPKALKYNFKLAELRLPDAKDLTRQKP